MAATLSILVPRHASITRPLTTSMPGHQQVANERGTNLDITQHQGTKTHKTTRAHCLSAAALTGERRRHLPPGRLAGQVLISGAGCKFCSVSILPLELRSL